jgi:hypothetical protein
MKNCAMLLTAIAAGPALAASSDKDTPAGRYASDASACKAKDYFVTITASETILPTFSCKGVAYDQIENKGGRAVYEAEAKSCMGEESTKPREERFTLVVDAAGMQILWADGTKSAVFTRCAEKQ